MITKGPYIAASLKSSIHRFLRALPANEEAAKYCLITCLDSHPEPGLLLDSSPQLLPAVSKATKIGTGVLVATDLLREIDGATRIFFGFDEVWFFPTDSISAKPTGVSIVGPGVVEQEGLNTLYDWMIQNDCSLGLGDGDGMNLIVKAQGVVRSILAHSMDQYDA